MTLRHYLARLIWLCVLPLVVLAAWMAFAYVNDMRADRDRIASDQARNAADTIDLFLQSNIDGLRFLATSPFADNPVDQGLLYREALGFREHFGGHVILADPDLRMLFNTRVPLGQPLPALPRPKGHAAAPEVLATGKPSVGDVFSGPIAGEPLFAIVVPVVRNGRTVHLLLSTVEARRLQARAVTALAEGSPASGAVPVIAEFEAVPNIAVQGYDRERLVIFWNSASEAIYGFTREEALGRRIEELIIPPGMREEVIRALTAWVDGGQPTPAGELELCRKDGSPANVFSGRAMLASGAGEPGMYCVDVDLSALRRAEAMAIAWRDRYVAAVRASGQILHEWRPSTGEMTAMGDTERILGYGAGETAGGLAWWRKILHPDDLPAFDRGLEQAIADREPFHQKYRVRRNDGEWLTMRDDGYFVLDDAGKIACMVCFVVDVTERVRSSRQIESQLEELQRWYRVTLGREKRIDELKAEVNELRRRLGERLPYRSPDTEAIT